MNANGILKQHWLHVALHFVVDAIIFAVAFVIGAAFKSLVDAFVGANVFALVTPETGKVRVVTPH